MNLTLDLGDLLALGALIVSVWAVVTTNKFNQRQLNFERTAERQVALNAWQKELEEALKATLGLLATGFERAVANHPRANKDYAAEVVAEIRAAAPLRNAICHTCWQPASAVVAKPFFVSRNLEVLESEIDIAWLEQLHRHVAQLALDVMDTVTATGLAFPGTADPSQASRGREG